MIKTVKDRSSSEHITAEDLCPVRGSSTGSKQVSESCVRGSVLIMVLYDVCEEIRLAELGRILGAPAAALFPQATSSERIRFVRPPVREPIEGAELEGGVCAGGQIKYYDYGVVSVTFDMPFAGKWQSLIELASRWLWDSTFEGHALRLVRQKLMRAAQALAKPYPEWLSEDYVIFQIHEVSGTTAPGDLVSQFGQQIAQVVRGEVVPLSDSERSEVLQSRISYYQNDLAVIGWNSAFVFDTAVGAQATTELLEYANSQLLEFRHYDELLSRELEGVYRMLEKGTGALARWRLAHEATRLHTVLLEVTELTEHTENAIKFLGDMFSARFHRMVAMKIGVPDYKNLVSQKLRTAEELYHFMVDQFHQGRAFILEAIVVVILVIELAYYFYGPVSYH